MRREQTIPFEAAVSLSVKLQVMIVCVHLHGDRSPKIDRDFMQPSSGLHIASLIDTEQYNVSLYHKMWHGTLDVSTLKNTIWFF